MTTQSKSYMNFLGGEVSPNAYKRLDMAGNSKWFETAKNIYFGTTGDIYNRRGFQYVGIGGSGITGEKLKLIPFVFNRSQSYCIEFSSNSFRILKNGAFLKDGNDDIISVPHPGLTLSDSDDISYAQVGDYLYICNGARNGIFTIKRVSETNWVWESFDFEVPPMRKVNEDQTQQLTFAAGGTYANSGYFSVEIGPISGTYENIVVDALVSGTRTIIYAASSTLNGIAEIVADFNNTIDPDTSVISYAKVSGKSIVFYLKTGYTLETVTDLRVKVGSGSSSLEEVVYSEGLPAYTRHYAANLYWLYYYYPSTHADYKIKEIEIYQTGNTPSVDAGYIPSDKSVISKQYATAVLPSVAVSDIVSDASYRFYRFVSSTYPTAIPPVPEKFLEYDTTNHNFKVGGFNYSNNAACWLKRILFEYLISEDTYYTATPTPIATNTVYTVTGNFDFFAEKLVGEVFAVDSIYSPCHDGAPGINKTVAMDVSTGTTVTDGFWSNGTWRFVNSGLFAGTIELQYSYDGSEWFTHRTFSSSIRTENSISYGTNYNEFGTLDVDDNVMLRLNMNITGAVNLRVTLDTESFKNRSYFKILEKTSDTVAVVTSVKYSVGVPGITKRDPLTDIDAVSPISEWSESAWSYANGFPKYCFLYQNRLAFANTLKDNSTIWFSRTDNYKDFSTKLEYQDDDPITITVLKPTGISEITGIAASKKLFVFSGDREYGIKDEGALTQANKELISFSTYGSEPIETRVVSNRVIFVEHGGRAARSLVYDYASENYEAPDLTIPFKHLLTNEVITATEYVPGDYKTYLMLTSSGRILMFKYIPEQRIEACSWFKHADGDISNICVVNNDKSYDLYIALDCTMGKTIEYMHIVPFSQGTYLDSFKQYSYDSEVSSITDSSYIEAGKNYIVLIDNNRFKVVAGGDNTIILPVKSKNIIVGKAYVSEATMIEPNLMFQNGTTNYNRKNLFKAHFSFLDSVGFSVGTKNNAKSFKKVYAIKAPSIEEPFKLYSGDKNFVIQSSYLEPNMLSFVQEEPYNMHITNAEIEVDYGGK